MSILLCAIDYSAPGDAALSRALDLLAADPDATLYVVHVREAPDVRPGTGLQGLCVTEDAKLKAHVADTLAKRGGGALDARVTPKIVAGVGRRTDRACREGVAGRPGGHRDRGPHRVPAPDARIRRGIRGPHRSVLGPGGPSEGRRRACEGTLRGSAQRLLQGRA